MKKIFFFFILLISLLFGTDFQKGIELYEKGDYQNALQAWMAIAKQGDVGAQFNIGVMYAKGQGVAQDHKEAVYWFTQAANKGDIKAQFILRDIYTKGEWVAKDSKQAAYWHTQAIDQKDWDNLNLEREVVSLCKEAGIKPLDFLKWKQIYTQLHNYGNTLENISQIKIWMKNSFSDPDILLQWVDKTKINWAFMVDEVYMKTLIQYKKANFSNPKEVKLYIDNNVQTDDAKKIHALNLNLEQLAYYLSFIKDPKIIAQLDNNVKKFCNNRIDTFSNLLSLNPYAQEGKCYIFKGKSTQIISKTRAFYIATKPEKLIFYLFNMEYAKDEFILDLNFNRDYANKEFYGLIRVVGVTKLTDNSIIPQAISIQSF